MKVIDDGRYIVYVDVDSIELYPYFHYEDDDSSAFAECIIALVKTIPTGDQAKKLFRDDIKKGSYVTEICVFNIRANQYQSIRQFLHDKKGRIIESRSEPFDIVDFEDVIPDTNSGILYDFVKQYYNNLWHKN